MNNECAEHGLNLRDKAMQAYAADDYYQAIQLIHNLLESSVRTLMFFSGAERSSDELRQAEQVYDGMGLNQGAKSLYVLGVISKAQCDRALHLKQMHDDLIHDFDEKASVELKKSEFDQVFLGSKELADEFLLLASRTEV